jgi:DNA replication protein DnaC
MDGYGSLKEIRAEVARGYAQRRLQAERQAEQHQDEIFRRFPELARLERAIGIAGAQLLVAGMTPDGAAAAERTWSALKEEKSRLLDDLGLKADYAEPRYACPNCADTGYSGGRRCACYAREIQPFLRAYYHLDVLQEMTFERYDPQVFDPHPEQPGGPSQRAYMLRLKELSEQWVADFIKNKRAGQPEAIPDNLLFSGPTGTGKTWLAGCIANALSAANIMVFYQPATQLFDLIQTYRKLKQTFSPDPDELEEAEWLYQSLRTVDLLIIDDIGTEHARADERLAEWLELLRARLGGGRRTLLSTNLDTASIKGMYDERVSSRLLGHFRMIRFWGKDARLFQKMQSHRSNEGKATE